MRPAHALALPALLLCAPCGCHSGSTSNVPFEACGPEASDVVERDWVVTSLRWGGESEGFDLDDEDTRCDSGCIPDATGGVDSRMGCIEDSIEDFLEAIHRGPCTSFLCNPQSTLEDGRVTMLIKVREGTVSDGDSCREAAYYNGVDVDANPADNDSGSEPLEVAPGSMIEGGSDLVNDARYAFLSGGEVIETRWWLHSSHAVEIVVTSNEGERSSFAIQMARLWMDQRRDTSRGMLAGFIPVEDMAAFMSILAAELGDIDPESAMNLVVNQADGDLVPEGATDDVCTTDGDCPLPWQDCGADGLCIEPAGRMDAISATLVFEAMPCTITGIAEE